MADVTGGLRMAGIMLRHKTARSGFVFVPIPTKPFPPETWEECPGCHQVHQCKTVHAIVNDSGLVMVSAGVLEDMKHSPTWDEWEVVGEEKEPPPLHIDGKSSLSLLEQRQKQDQEHRRLIIGRR